jgi:hypothetical protein
LWRELIRAVCSAWLVTEVLHSAYHLAHLDHFTVAEAFAQTASLALLLVLAAAVLALIRQTGEL